MISISNIESFDRYLHSETILDDMSFVCSMPTANSNSSLNGAVKAVSIQSIWDFSTSQVTNKGIIINSNGSSISGVLNYQTLQSFTENSHSAPYSILCGASALTLPDPQEQIIDIRSGSGIVVVLCSSGHLYEKGLSSIGQCENLAECQWVRVPLYETAPEVASQNNSGSNASFLCYNPQMDPVKDFGIMMGGIVVLTHSGRVMWFGEGSWWNENYIKYKTQHENSGINTSNPENNNFELNNYDMGSQPTAPYIFDLTDNSMFIPKMYPELFNNNNNNNKLYGIFGNKKISKICAEASAFISDDGTPFVLASNSMYYFI